MQSLLLLVESPGCLPRPESDFVLASESLNLLFGIPVAGEFLNFLTGVNVLVWLVEVQQSVAQPEAHLCHGGTLVVIPPFCQLHVPVSCPPSDATRPQHGRELAGTALVADLLDSQAHKPPLL